MTLLIQLILCLAFVLFPTYGAAKEWEDGTYDATVTTPSGTYSVPVEVSDGEVESVNWPNGGDMHVSDAEIDGDGEASGTNSRGDVISIEVEEQ